MTSYTACIDQEGPYALLCPAKPLDLTPCNGNVYGPSGFLYRTSRGRCRIHVDVQPLSLMFTQQVASAMPVDRPWHRLSAVPPQLLSS